MEYYAGMKKVKANLSVGAWKVSKIFYLIPVQYITYYLISLKSYGIFLSYLSIYIIQGLANFFYKVSIVNSFTFECHMVSVITLPLCPCNVKVAIGDT